MFSVRVSLPSIIRLGILPIRLTAPFSVTSKSSIDLELRSLLPRFLCSIAAPFPDFVFDGVAPYDEKSQSRQFR